jgi:hypothetical protein
VVPQVSVPLLSGKPVCRTTASRSSSVIVRPILVLTALCILTRSPMSKLSALTMVVVLFLVHAEFVVSPGPHVF